jgi:MFS family permease
VTATEEPVRLRWVLAAVSVALFCVQIDYFAVNLALPRMAFDLKTTAPDLQWVISVYMLALGAFVVPAGRIGDIFGRRRTLLAGVALFGLSSALCALAPSATLVIAFRAVQGLGAALIFPVSVSVLTTAFPSARASHAIGLAYGIAGLGNAAGPLIGGLFTETVGWRWIFWLNVPLTLAVLAIGARSITESFDETVPRRIDITGLALITVGIGLFTLTFDRAPGSWICRRRRSSHSSARSRCSRCSSSSRTARGGHSWICRWPAILGSRSWSSHAPSLTSPTA